MRILPLTTLLFSASFILLLTAGCGSSDSDYQKTGDCSDFTLDENNCRLNFVFLEARYQSCCTAWIKDEQNKDK